MLNRDDLLNAQHTKSVRISTGEVLIRALTWEDFQAISSESIDGDVKQHEMMILRGLSDSNGERLLRDEDVAAVRKLPGADFTKLVSEITKHGEIDELAEEVANQEND